MDREFTYDVEPNSQCIIDSKNDTMICLTKMSWNGGTYKLDLRKWRRKGEDIVPNKGFSFLTEDGPNKLAEVLVSKGYGDTQVLQSILNKRPKEHKPSEKVYSSNKLLDVIKK